MSTPFDPPEPLYRTVGIRAVEAHYLKDAEPPLMERAGAAATAVALEMLKNRPGPVLVAAGPGNNGGDAFVVARLLREHGREVVVAFIGNASRLPEDAALAVTAFGAAGGTVQDSFPERQDFALAVDGIFGIGLTRAVEGSYAEWIDHLNHLRCPILAIDIPSGLDADTGQVWGVAVHARRTATFIALKPGLLSLEGPDHAGEISLHDLDLDVAAAHPAEGLSITPALFTSFLRPRPRNSHKGMHGSAGIIGGASGMVGAALLAGRAALHLGAGKVFLGLVESSALKVDPEYPELMLQDALELLSARTCTCLAVGPGLGLSENAHHALSLAVYGDTPLLLDADALNILSAAPALNRQVARRNASTLVTPHPAEAARLLNCSTREIQADRINAALEISHRLRAWTVLKGCGSVLAAPDGRWWLNTTGNPGMSSAGMGDVLSGMALALLAQGWHGEEALLAAVHLHGAAADACVAAGRGPLGLTASELIPAARKLLNTWITLNA